TRVRAREWILANIPAGSGIVEEDWTAPLSSFGFEGARKDARRASLPPQCYELLEQRTLAQVYSTPRTLEDYRKDGARYLVASSERYGLYYAEPRRYAPIVAFYDRLFREGRLLKEFSSPQDRSGPVVRVYDIGEAAEPREAVLTAP